MPSAMVDLVPTVLHIHGLDDAEFKPDGRVLKEILNTTSEGINPRWEKEHSTKKINSNGTQYELEVHTSKIGESVYLDFTKVNRTHKEL